LLNCGYHARNHHRHVGRNSLQLVWPADHIAGGEAQTNNLAVGLNTNWFMVAGSSTTNQMYLPIDPINGGVFLRLTYP
jgi:hypothetical protein